MAVKKRDGFPLKTVSFHSVVRSLVRLHDLRGLGGLAEELCVLVGEDNVRRLAGVLYRLRMVEAGQQIRVGILLQDKQAWRFGYSIVEWLASSWRVAAAARACEQLATLLIRMEQHRSSALSRM